MARRVPRPVQAYRGVRRSSLGVGWEPECTITGDASLLISYSDKNRDTPEGWIWISAGQSVADIRRVYIESPVQRCWVQPRSEPSNRWFEVDDEYILRDGDSVRFETGGDWTEPERLVPLPLSDGEEATLLESLIEERDRLGKMGQ